MSDNYLELLYTYKTKQNTCFIISRDNFICCGKASGIAITENGRGHITHNVISEMQWAGIDIRNGANPVVSHNVIENGQSDGIVIADMGKSVIVDNTITGEFIIRS